MVHEVDTALKLVEIVGLLLPLLLIGVRFAAESRELVRLDEGESAILAMLLFAVVLATATAIIAIGIVLIQPGASLALRFALAMLVGVFITLALAIADSIFGVYRLLRAEQDEDLQTRLTNWKREDEDS